MIWLHGTYSFHQSSTFNCLLTSTEFFSYQTKIFKEHKVKISGVSMQSSLEKPNQKALDTEDRPDMQCECFVSELCGERQRENNMESVVILLNNLTQFYSSCQMSNKVVSHRVVICWRWSRKTQRTLSNQYLHKAWLLQSNKGSEQLHWMWTSGWSLPWVQTRQYEQKRSPTVWGIRWSCCRERYNALHVAFSWTLLCFHRWRHKLWLFFLEKQNTGRKHQKVGQNAPNGKPAQVVIVEGVVVNKAKEKWVKKLKHWLFLSSWNIKQNLELFHHCEDFGADVLVKSSLHLGTSWWALTKMTWPESRARHLS